MINGKNDNILNECNRDSTLSNDISSDEPMDIDSTLPEMTNFSSHNKIDSSLTVLNQVLRAIIEFLFKV